LASQVLGKVLGVFARRPRARLTLEHILESDAWARRQAGAQFMSNKWIRAGAFFAAALAVFILYPAAFRAMLGIGMVITLHELGHFWAAKATGIRVEVFSLGFGLLW